MFRIRLKSRNVLLLLAVALIGVGILAGLGLIFELGPFNSDAAFQNALLDRNAVKLSPRIHLLGQLVPSVAYAIETSEGLVLIDTGLEADASKLLKQLEDLNLADARILALLLTHVHGDHTQGARYLREETGAKIYAGQRDCEPLRDGGPREAFFSTFPMDGYHLHATPVDVELKGGEKLVFGDTTIEVIATPGHTPGSTCYLLHSRGERALFGGDTISSLIADLGTYSAYLAPRYRGNARDYLTTLRNLRLLPKPDLVLPGHPNEQGHPHSPRLSETAWHKLLDRGIRDLEVLVARYDADGEDFLDGQPKPLLTGLHYLGDYRGRAVYVLRTRSQQFLFDAPGDDGLAEFVSNQLQAIGSEMSSITAALLTSSNQQNIAGLTKVAELYNCPVVAAAEAHEVVRAVCPSSVPLMTPEDLVKSNWFPVQVIPLKGCGPGAVGYLVQLEQREVLISGNIPSSLSPPSVTDLKNALAGPSGDYRQYMGSLSILHNLHPNLWLPAHPLNGQNANLYDDQWHTILGKNVKLSQER